MRSRLSGCLQKNTSQKTRFTFVVFSRQNFRNLVGRVGKRRTNMGFDARAQKSLTRNTIRFLTSLRNFALETCPRKKNRTVPEELPISDWVVSNLLLSSKHITVVHRKLGSFCFGGKILGLLQHKFISQDFLDSSFAGEHRHEEIRTRDHRVDVSECDHGCRLSLKLLKGQHSGFHVMRRHGAHSVRRAHPWWRAHAKMRWWKLRWASEGPGSFRWASCRIFLRVVPTEKEKGALRLNKSSFDLFGEENGCYINQKIWVRMQKKTAFSLLRNVSLKTSLIKVQFFRLTEWQTLCGRGCEAA